MNQVALKALKGSIKKWKGIVAGDVTDQGSDNCPLCVAFHKNYCAKCPVMKKTGVACCNKTPYRTDWCLVAGEGHTADSPPRVAAAKKELKFLRSLLPPKKSAK